MQESGLNLNQQNPLSLRTRSRRKSSIFFDTAKRYNEKMTEHFNSGESSFIFGINFHNQYWSDDRWKACLVAGGGSKRRYQYCSDISGIIVYLRALQGHPGRSLIDPSLQDNVAIQSGFFHHICLFRMCFESSFNHQQRIDTWRSGFKQETNSILLA